MAAQQKGLTCAGSRTVCSRELVTYQHTQRTFWFAVPSTPLIFLASHSISNAPGTFAQNTLARIINKRLVNLNVAFSDGINSTRWRLK